MDGKFFVEVILQLFDKCATMSRRIDLWIYNFRNFFHTH